MSGILLISAVESDLGSSTQSFQYPNLLSPKNIHFLVLSDTKLGLIRYYIKVVYILLQCLRFPMICRERSQHSREFYLRISKDLWLLTRSVYMVIFTNRRVKILLQAKFHMNMGQNHTSTGMSASIRNATVQTLR